MQNAHERFGNLEFTKRTKDSAISVRVQMDRCVIEPPTTEHGQSVGHLISVIGGDADIAAIWSAASDGAAFRLHLPNEQTVWMSMGAEARSFRGSLSLAGRKRPLRHLVVLSQELMKTKPGIGCDATRTVLCDDNRLFVLYRLARRFGLPAVPDWATWFMAELNQRKAIRPLIGVGCSPVLISGTRQMFLKWIGKALRNGHITFPEANGAISWIAPENSLNRSALHAPDLEVLGFDAEQSQKGGAGENCSESLQHQSGI
jgi:hypothetical protein